MWLPVMTFFALGFEHGVVNLFVIPAGMLLGAPVGVGDWWLWNQLPVLAGNFLGALTLVAMAMSLAHPRGPAHTSPDGEPAGQPVTAAPARP
ncbi:formate/nitrite transporter family protein [Georgenia sp. M64]|uniref:formate/nitrite transporter family protein n=1 Tax=Georgenia sp. M64 TaxID=3120520 RepID=UPI0030E0D71F